MKRLLVLILLLVPVLCYAASSVVELPKSYRAGDGSIITALSLNWTDDDNASGAGTFTDYVINTSVEGRHIMAVVDPGATSPTAAYDISIVDGDGEDIYGGMLTNLSATVTIQASPITQSDNASIERPVIGTLTLDIDNQEVDSATGKVILYFVE